MPVSKKTIDRSFKHSTIQILINFSGDNNNKRQLFSSKMKNPNEIVKHEGVKLYFSPVIKYSNDLFKEAKIPVNISTFTDQNLFKKLLEFGASKQKVPRYKTNKSVGITNHNIDFMVDLLFKEGSNIYIPFDIDYTNLRKYIIRRAILKTKFKDSQKDKLEKDGVVRIVMDITVLDASKAEKMTKEDFTRLSCKEKKKDILEHINELFDTTYKVIDNSGLNFINLNLPPTHSSGSDYINPSRQLTYYPKSYSENMKQKSLTDSEELAGMLVKNALKKKREGEISKLINSHIQSRKDVSKKLVGGKKYTRKKNKILRPLKLYRKTKKYKSYKKL